MNESLLNLMRKALALTSAHRRVLACLLVKARGSTPQSAGALMLIDDAAQLHGTIGGGCVEAEVRREAVAMLARGETPEAGLRRFKLDHDYGWDDGLICGGTIELALAPPPDGAMLELIVAKLERNERAMLPIEIDIEGETHCYTLEIPPRARLVIAGAGHVGAALARLAVPLEFDVVLVDDRPDLLVHAKQRAGGDDAIETISGDIADALRSLDIDYNAYGVIVTRGHKHDEEALEALLGRNAAYLGMIGSRRKVKLILDDLRERGADDHDLARVHAPIGLDIGSVSVEEIALSIAAELVQVRSARGALRVHHEVIANAPVAADDAAA